MLIPATFAAKYLKMTYLKRAAVACALVLLPGFIWTIITLLFVAVPFVDKPYHPGTLWPGDPNVIFDSTDVRAQMQVFLHDPLLLITLPSREILRVWPQSVWLDSIIGMLGSFDIRMTKSTYVEWYLAVFFALLSGVIGRREQAGRVRPVAVGIGIAALAATVYAIYITEYLAWTHVGADTIDGVYGRYLLPLIVSIPAFLPSFRFRASQVLAWTFAGPIFVMAAASMVALPATLVKTYYLR